MGRASLSQQCEEQKRCFGSPCCQAELCAVKKRSNQMSSVPSEQREDAGLKLPLAGVSLGTGLKVRRDIEGERREKCLKEMA